MNGAKRRNRKRKESQGYDPNTPRCDIYVHVQKASFGHPEPGEIKSATWLPYIPARCLIGDFPVTPVGLCDNWEGLDGSKLDGDDE